MPDLAIIPPRNPDLPTTPMNRYHAGRLADILERTLGHVAAGRGSYARVESGWHAWCRILSAVDPADLAPSSQHPSITSLVDGYQRNIWEALLQHFHPDTPADVRAYHMKRCLAYCEVADVVDLLRQTAADELPEEPHAERWERKAREAAIQLERLKRRFPGPTDARTIQFLESEHGIAPGEGWAGYIIAKADEHGIPVTRAAFIFDTLGEDEAFDGFVTALQDAEGSDL